MGQTDEQTDRPTDWRRNVTICITLDETSAINQVST